MRRYEISDENWQRFADLLPGKASDRGQTAKDNRCFINLEYTAPVLLMGFR